MFVISAQELWAFVIFFLLIFYFLFYILQKDLLFWTIPQNSGRKSAINRNHIHSNKSYSLSLFEGWGEWIG